MTDRTPIAADTILERHRDEVLELWTRSVREQAGSHYRDRTPDEISSWGQRALSVVIGELRSPSTERVDAYARWLSDARWRMGFDADEVVRSLLLLLEVALPFVWEECPSAAIAQRRTSKLTACFREAVVRFTDLHADTMRRSLEDRRLRVATLYRQARRSAAEMRTLNRVNTAVLDGLGLQHVLDVLCREARALTGARGSAVLLRGEDGLVAVEHSVGSCSDESARRWLDSMAAALPARAILEDEVTGQSRTSAGPATGTLPERPPGIGSMLTAPVRKHEDVVGAVVLADDRGGFDQGDLALTRLLAGQLGVAIEHARLHEAHERTAIIEERQKLARELHDSVAQSLYGVALTAEAALRLLESGDVKAACPHVGTVRDSALDALREMRLLIFDLRPPASFETVGLRAALATRLRTVEERVGVETELECEGAEHLPRELEEAFYGIAREGLNNCLKHARASRVTVSVHCDEAEATLRIEDDGVGFRRHDKAEQGGLGIRGMEERAVRIGGTLDIATEPGRGTTLTVSAPLSAGSPAAGAVGDGLQGAAKETTDG
ncbi:GAF domain-containing sensor histidine kinase [bacterium]|nr:GAF domain-containing sensor histidine kinase [bacterium]